SRARFLRAIRRPGPWAANPTPPNEEVQQSSTIARSVSMPNPSNLEVLGIAGSLRNGSFNRALLRAAQEVAPEGMTIRVFDELASIPLYNGDVEAQGIPAPVVAFKQAIARAGALLIAT